MPLFRRALWPHDHRDELVAGALVGAVVVVLGYASGIGAPAASSDATAAPPPAATSPSSPEGAAPPENPGDAAEGSAGGAPAPGAMPGTGVYYPGGTGEDHTGHLGGGTGGAGHSGHGASPAPSDSAPPSSPSPSAPGTTPPGGDDATCEDGEVRLARPLLTGLTQPVFGLLDPAASGAQESAAPEPRPSPCIGLAPLPSLLGGISPTPEATP
ncbi:hypothetical protein AB5J49_19145 [Streptomyces sp. R28]|uniref:Uncharacterized protein n=1 Tax=Streptomyces sp. R28 TaxID=3238628 RepID=A0AB39PWV4_9ACTN